MDASLWGADLPPEQPIEAIKPLRQLTDKQILQHRSKDNPCVRVFGAGPEGKQCKTCSHLHAKHWDKTYYKCDLRPDTNGPGTDHRVRWVACSRYEERQEETP